MVVSVHATHFILYRLYCQMDTMFGMILLDL